ARKVHLNRGELPLPRDAAGHTKPESSAGGAFLNPDPYDLNDDGVFDVTDYANDARVSDANGNGLLDPQDLIRAFSNGTDDDGNGYVDDIAGWNFLDDDNDPFDEVSYSHGTGEAEDSTAEADNGGALGTCPNCRIMPVRVGDSFIADSNNFAQGVVFAVDSGAHIVQEALGAVNNPSFARAAIEYAWNNDVPIIASAADEESFHHNPPAANKHTITVNSVTRFASQGGFTMSPHSYLYLNGCTNYGGNIAVAIESSSCSSEATGRGCGRAVMLISDALDRVDAGALQPRRVDPTGNVHPLSADEVQQLLTMTADDIDFSSDRTVSFILSAFGIDTIRYASQPGWDEYFGAGRANAHHAVQAVANDALPPEADLLTPDWWQTLDPVRTPTVTVTGAAAATRATSYGWELAAGCGVQPTEDRFTTIASASGLSASSGPGTLASRSIRATAMRFLIDPACVPPPAGGERDAVPRRHPGCLHGDAAAARHRRRRPARRGTSHRLPASRRRPPAGLPAEHRRQRRAVAALRPAARQDPARHGAKAQAAGADRPDLRRHHPGAARQRTLAAGLAGAPRPAAAARRIARVRQRRAAHGVVRVVRWRGSGRRHRRGPPNRGRRRLARRQALRLGAGRHPPRPFPGPDGAPFPAPQPPRPLHPPPARAARGPRPRRSRRRRPPRDRRRRHGPPCLRLARRREHAAGMARARRRPDSDGLDRPREPSRGAEHGGRTAGRAPGNEGRVDARRRPAARRRQAGRRGRQ